MKNNTTSLLSEHIIKSNEAMGILFENKHHEAALILIYSWVDRLAWLSVKNDYSTGNDFKVWLNKYLFNQGKVYPFNANDLWGARCALLHTGTSEARDVKNGKARTVFYYGGQMEVTPTKPNEHVYVNIGNLHVGLIEASTRFIQYLNNNPEELSRVNIKLGKILSRTTDF